MHSGVVSAAAAPVQSAHIACLLGRSLTRLRLAGAQETRTANLRTCAG
jgi:hypothetical protein